MPSTTKQQRFLLVNVAGQLFVAAGGLPAWKTAARLRSFDGLYAEQCLLGYSTRTATAAPQTCPSRALLTEIISFWVVLTMCLGMGNEIDKGVIRKHCRAI